MQVDHQQVPSQTKAASKLQISQALTAAPAMPAAMKEIAMKPCCGTKMPPQYGHPGMIDLAGNDTR
jgi:hypothetical protein